MSKYGITINDYMIDWLIDCSVGVHVTHIGSHRFLRKIGLRTPELVGLAHQFCASYVSVCTCSKFIEKNQIIINSMKHAMCNIHINDNYSKYFVYNNSNIILFYSDFTNNSLYDIALVDVIFRFWVTSQ